MSDQEIQDLITDLDSCKTDIFASISHHILHYLSSRPTSDKLSLPPAELACLARFMDAGPPEDVELVYGKIVELVDGETGAALEAIKAQSSVLVEECRACKQKIPLAELLSGSCENGHVWRKSIFLVFVHDYMKS